MGREVGVEVIILGSGAATPQIGRANASYLIRTDLPLLFDIGPGSLMNLLHAKIDRSELGHLFWTHLHADHISDFIPFFFNEACYSRSNGRGDIALYGPAGTRRLAGNVVRTFPGFSRARFELRVKDLKAGQVVRIGQTRVTACPVKHSPRMKSLGYRVEYNGRTVAYSGDTVDSPELVRLCRGADLAIVEATFPAERPMAGHLTAPQACRAARAAGVKRLVLTHFDSIWREYDVESECSGLFDGEMILAEDLMRVSVA